MPRSTRVSTTEGELSRIYGQSSIITRVSPAVGRRSRDCFRGEGMRIAFLAAQ